MTRIARAITIALLLLAAATLLLGQTASVQTPGTVIVNGHALAGVVTMPITAGAVTFDGAHGICFVATVTGAVTGATLLNIVPGQLYTFEIIEGATAYPFVWPSNFYGVTAVPGAANHISVQIGVGLSDGSMLGISSIGSNAPTP